MSSGESYRPYSTPKLKIVSSKFAKTDENLYHNGLLAVAQDAKQILDQTFQQPDHRVPEAEARKKTLFFLLTRLEMFEAAESGETVDRLDNFQTIYRSAADELAEIPDNELEDLLRRYKDTPVLDALLAVERVTNNKIGIESMRNITVVMLSQCGE
jgi:hypothetical protein